MKKLQFREETEWRIDEEYSRSTLRVCSFYQSPVNGYFLEDLRKNISWYILQRDKTKLIVTRALMNYFEFFAMKRGNEIFIITKS